MEKSFLAVGILWWGGGGGGEDRAGYLKTKLNEEITKSNSINKVYYRLSHDVVTEM